MANPRCEICCESTGSSSEKVVQCSGPCGKAFHAFCTELNLSYWKAWSARVGLLWFCATCREAVGRKEEQMEVESIGENREDEDVKNVAVEALELLPEEIWLKVFQSLSGYQMRQVRMTCRSWNQIVGDSGLLMKRIVLRLPKGIILDPDCEQTELLSSCKSRYLHIVLDEIRIIEVYPWWPSVAEHLESLTITKSQITIDMLLKMLAPLFNLKSLTFTCGPYVDSNNCSLMTQLPALEQLILKEVDQPNLLDVFRHLCPRLKMFKLSSGSCPETHPQQVIKFIKSVKGTLEGLELPMVDHLWQSITAIDGLCLRWISLTNCTEQLAVSGHQVVILSQQYPSAEVLLLPPKLLLYDNILEAIGSNLTNLLYLKIYHNTRENSVAFLQRMPHLIRIAITGNDRYYGSTADFTPVRNENLKLLSLNTLKISKSYSNSFPNITHLHLEQCTFTSWSHIFDSKLESLQRVTLRSVRVEKREECLAAYFSQMQYLSITESSVSRSLLAALFSLCRNLTEVRLIKVDEVDDALMLVLAQKLKNLRKITVKGCYKTTKLTQEYVEKHCPEMESIGFDKKHVSVYRDEYYQDDYDDYVGGPEFVYDYSF